MEPTNVRAYRISLLRLTMPLAAAVAFTATAAFAAPPPPRHPAAKAHDESKVPDMPGSPATPAAIVLDGHIHRRLRPCPTGMTRQGAVSKNGQLPSCRKKT
jgi:hypothetical protein